jgi:hypothetical protein
MALTTLYLIAISNSTGKIRATQQNKKISNKGGTEQISLISKNIKKTAKDKPKRLI